MDNSKSPIPKIGDVYLIQAKNFNPFRYRVIGMEFFHPKGSWTENLILRIKIRNIDSNEMQESSLYRYENGRLEFASFNDECIIHLITEDQKSSNFLIDKNPLIIPFNSQTNFQSVVNLSQFQSLINEEGIDYFSSLPMDIIYLIVEGLEEKELINLCQTCKRLGQLSWDNKFWKYKVSQIFPEKIPFLIRNENPLSRTYWRDQYLRLKICGDLYVFGKNDIGVIKLDSENQENIYRPHKVYNFDQKIKNVSFYYNSFRVLDEFGDLYGKGNLEIYGKLSEKYNPPEIPKEYFKLIDLGYPVSDVLTPGTYDIIKKNDHEMSIFSEYYSCGKIKVYRFPMKILDISGYSEGLAIILENGTCWFKGNINFLEQNLPSSVKCSRKGEKTIMHPFLENCNRIWCNAFGTIILDKDGKFKLTFSFCCNSDKNQIPRDIISDKKGKKAAIGWKETLFLFEDGTVYSLYTDTDEEFTNADFKEITLPFPILDIEAHSNSYCLIDIHHNVYMKGDNSYGQLGLGETIKNVEEFTLLPNIKAQKVVFFWDKSAIISYNF